MENWQHICAVICLQADIAVLQGLLL